MPGERHQPHPMEALTSEAALFPHSMNPWLICSPALSGSACETALGKPRYGFSLLGGNSSGRRGA